MVPALSQEGEGPDRAEPPSVPSQARGKLCWRPAHREAAKQHSRWPAQPGNTGGLPGSGGCTTMPQGNKTHPLQGGTCFSNPCLPFPPHSLPAEAGLAPKIRPQMPPRASSGRRPASHCTRAQSCSCPLGYCCYLPAAGQSAGPAHIGSLVCVGAAGARQPESAGGSEQAGARPPRFNHRSPTYQPCIHRRVAPHLWAHFICKMGTITPIIFKGPRQSLP